MFMKVYKVAYLSIKMSLFQRNYKREELLKTDVIHT